MEKIKKLGFIGLGLMGNPMVERLLNAGFDVCVWARSPEKAKRATDAGATLYPSVASLVDDVEVLMLCVSNTAAVQDVVTGQSGVLSALAKNQFSSLSVIVDFSSIAPNVTRDIAEQADKYNVKWVDSPVSGGVAGAEQGTLAVMCGGDPVIISSLMPFYEPLAGNVTHMGPTGSGQVTKIANQMLVSCNIMVMAEMFALAEKAGVDAGKIPQALKGGFADSIPLQLTGPVWQIKSLMK